MIQLYSAGNHRNIKVITVLVGGKDIPSKAECVRVLTMDPETESPVVIIPFGGVAQDDIGSDNVLAMEMIQRFTPRYVDDGDFYFRCTRISGLLLIKVIVERYFHCEPQLQVYDEDWDLA